MDWKIEPLGSSHEKTGFRCGKPPLDEFLTRFASQYAKRGLARTYVAVRGEEKAVCGYYSLAVGGVPFENAPAELSRKLPAHPIPVVLLARLAVDQSVQKAGLGRRLIGHAVENCLRVADQVGVVAVIVEAIDDEAVRYYQHYGFTLIPGVARQLFIRIDTLRKEARA